MLFLYCAATQISSGMFKKSKHKIAALFSRKPTPRPIIDYPQIPENSPERHTTPRERERATLTPVPGHPNKFWLAGGPPPQQLKDKYEEKRRMRNQAQERRIVTEENGRKFAELKEHGFAVRDFQRMHDRKRDKEGEAEWRREVEEIANRRSFRPRVEVV
jgi:hypothetical protein